MLRTVRISALVEPTAQRGRQTKPVGKLLANSDHCCRGKNEDVLGQPCRQRMVRERGAISEGLGRASQRLRPERSKGVTPVKVWGECSRWRKQQGQRPRSG